MAESLTKQERLEIINGYIASLRLSGSSDPLIHPDWSKYVWFRYFLWFIIEYPLCFLLELIYFIMTGISYFKLKKSNNLCKKDNQIIYNDTYNNNNNNYNNYKNNKISIIVSCYNENNSIEQLLLYIQKNCKYPANIELILVDGGSTDNWWHKLPTFVTAGKNKKMDGLITYDIIYVGFDKHKVSGRGTCQNIGTQYASYDILLFLHCDTIVCKHFDDIAINAINNISNLVIGSWQFSLDRGKCPYPLPGLLTLEKRVKLRTKLFLCPYGDHGYFMTKDMCTKLGGIPNLCIMEDYEFISKARKYMFENNGYIYIDSNPFYTCPKKWYKSGRVWKNTIRNQIVCFLYDYMDYAPSKIYEIYYGKKL